MARPAREKSEIITVPVRGMFNGVSQQAPHARQEGYAEEQENMHSTVFDGIKKRPPTEYVSKLYNSPSATHFDTHFVDRGDDDEHIIIVHNGILSVQRLSDGVSMTVNNRDSAQTYLGGGDTVAGTKFDFVTLHDVTLINNPTQTPTISATLSTAGANGANPEGFIFLKGSLSSGTDNKYTYDVGGNLANETVDTGDMEADAVTIAGVINGFTDFTATAIGPSVWVKKGNTTDFRLTASHTVDEGFASAVKGTVGKLTDLPIKAVHGFKIKISGSESTVYDDYYVKYECTSLDSTGNPPADGDIGDGIWVECAEPSATYKFSGGMPIALVKTGATTYDIINTTADDLTYSPQFRWSGRLVGDSTTNQNPLFIDKVVKSMSLFKGRLALISDEGVTFSEAGDMFNLFKNTVRSSLEGDAFNLVVSHPSASNFKHGLPYKDSFLLFGDSCQFKLSGSPVFSPSTAEADFVSSYEMTDKAHPILADQDVLFGLSRGVYSGLYKLSRSKTVEDELDGKEVSAHIPRYIKGDFVKLISQPKENLIVGFTDTDSSSLYVYKYYEDKNVEIQSSWSKFTFTGSTIMDIEFVDNELYIAELKANDVFYAHKMRFLTQDVEDDGNYVTYLDRRVNESQCTSISYDSATDETSLTLPYEIASGVTMEAYLRSTGSQIGGTKLAVTSQVADGSNKIIKILGDHDESSLFIGEKYSMSYTFSPPLLRQTDGRPIISGRTQVRSGRIDFQDSGYMKVEVTPENRDAYTYEYTGHIVGGITTSVNNVSITSGTFTFPVRTRNDGTTIKLTNDSAMPSKIVMAEFEMNYENRSRTS